MAIFWFYVYDMWTRHSSLVYKQSLSIYHQFQTFVIFWRKNLVLYWEHFHIYYKCLIGKVSITTPTSFGLAWFCEVKTTYDTWICHFEYNWTSKVPPLTWPLHYSRFKLAHAKKSNCFWYNLRSYPQNQGMWCCPHNPNMSSAKLSSYMLLQVIYNNKI